MGIVDFHNHVIPGVDDGAADLDDTRLALAALQASGVSSLVATPHVDASIGLRPERLAARMAELDEGWRALQECATSEFPALTVQRGAEIRLDVPNPDFADARFRLGGGNFVLIEFPHFAIPPRSDRVIAHLRERDWIPIIAHPERYAGLAADIELIAEWRAAGGYLQVNEPSVTGRYGHSVRELSVAILERGWADFLSSDYHARGRTEIDSCRQVLIVMDAAEQAELLLERNPARMLEGELPLVVPPVSVKRGFWERLISHRGQSGHRGQIRPL